MRGEFETIDRIAKRWKSQRMPNIVCGIGDDAAAFVPAPENILLVSTDLLIESIHFNDLIPAFKLGEKALAVNVSDIAAMGGMPRAFLTAIALPKETSDLFVDDLYAGFHAASQRFGLCLIGGDLSASLQGIFLCVTILGEAKNPVYRHGAKAGDLICVTGTLGDSALGWKLVQEKGKNEHPPMNDPDVQFLIERHFSPTPRVNTGYELATQGIASAMIDISDGLLGDLEHILQASRLGAQIYLNQIPLSPAYKRYAGQDLTDALSGGEDYELLFTVPSREEHKLAEISRQSQTAICIIGEITENQNLCLIDPEGREHKPTQTGFRHF